MKTGVSTNVPAAMRQPGIFTNGEKVNVVCPRCGSELFNDYGEPYCLHCGHLEELTMSGESIYDAKKDEVLKYLETLSATDTERKLGLTKNTIWAMLTNWKKRGLIPQDYKPPVRGRKHVKADSPRLPPSEHKGNDLHTNLPQWNEAWGDAVKVAWLNAFSITFGSK